MVQFKQDPPHWRRTGRTHNALVKAPKNSIYLAPNQQAVRYCEDICRAIGREDIKVMSAETALRNGAERLRGLEISDIELDHSFRLDAGRYNEDGNYIPSPEERAWDYVRSRIRNYKYGDFDAGHYCPLARHAMQSRTFHAAAR